MDNEVPASTAFRHPSRDIGFSAVATVLAVAVPKCPICWVALAGALGVGSAVSSYWSQPLAVALLLLPVSALFVRARARRGYGPFSLGLLAAVAMYLCKFRLDYEVGLYLSGATLLGASIWNAVPKRRAADDMQCHC